MLDFPDTAAALWAGFDAGQLPRPEYVLPVLFTESGLDPSRPNAAGFPYFGINQMSGDQLARQGIDPSDYLTWPASAQIARVVAPFYGAIQRQYGAIASGTLSYLANFLPARLVDSRPLSSVLAAKGDGTGIYEANYGLDVAGLGTITTGDLAHFVAKAASSSSVQAAIAATYAADPSRGSPSDPVWGTDYVWQRYKGYVYTASIAGAIIGAGAWLLGKGLKG